MGQNKPLEATTGAVTLAEASVLIEDPLRKGIIETVVKESTVLELLPFENITGNALTYIQEGETGGVGFREVNENYDHTNPTNVRQTESIKRLGSMVEVDRFIESTQNIHAVRANATASKAKAIANEFTRTFFSGSESTNSQEFDGLKARVENDSVVTISEALNKAVLTEDEAKEFRLKLHELLDSVKGGADVIFMNKRTRRKVTALFGSQGAYIQLGQDAFGRPIQYFGDVRIAVVDDEYLPDNDIYAVKFGMEDGVTGIQSSGVQAVDNGLRGVVYQTLIEWYMSIVVGNPNGVARLTVDKDAGDDEE